MMAAFCVGGTWLWLSNSNTSSRTIQDHPGPSRTPVQSSSISRFLFYAFAAWIPTPFFGNAGNATLALVLGKATQQDLRLNPDGNSATTKKTTG